MKRLAVLRHAKSQWGDEGRSDFDRPLNERGQKAARAIGRELSRRALKFESVVASPAVRVRETIAGINQTGDLGNQIEFDERIYLAEKDVLLAIVRRLDEDANSVLIVGHNPGLQQLVLLLAATDNAGRYESIANNLPTGGLVLIELAAERWTGIEPACGRIIDLVVPKDLG